MVESAPGTTFMPKTEFKRVFDGLLESYLGLEPQAEMIIRQIKKTGNAELRSKLIEELRNCETKRLDLLDKMDDLGK